MSKNWLTTFTYHSNFPHILYNYPVQAAIVTGNVNIIINIQLYVWYARNLGGSSVIAYQKTGLVLDKKLF